MANTYTRSVGECIGIQIERRTITNSISLTETDDEPHEKYLQVIDWNGSPQKQFKFPARYDLSSVVDDEENEVIYGLSINNDAIYKFDYSSVDIESTIN